MKATGFLPKVSRSTWSPRWWRVRVRVRARVRVRLRLRLRVWP